MTTMMNDLTLVANNIIEFVFVEPLHEDEIIEIISSGDARAIDVTVVDSARIVVVEHDELRDAIGIIADANVIELIALIRHTIEYDIIHDDNRINVKLET